MKRKSKYWACECQKGVIEMVSVGEECPECGRTQDAAVKRKPKRSGKNGNKS